MSRIAIHGPKFASYEYVVANYGPALREAACKEGTSFHVLDSPGVGCWVRVFLRNNCPNVPCFVYTVSDSVLPHGTRRKSANMRAAVANWKQNSDELWQVWPVLTPLDVQFRDDCDAVPHFPADVTVAHYCPTAGQMNKLKAMLNNSSIGRIRSRHSRERANGPTSGAKCKLVILLHDGACGALSTNIQHDDDDDNDE